MKTSDGTMNWNTPEKPQDIPIYAKNIISHIVGVRLENKFAIFPNKAHDTDAGWDLTLIKQIDFDRNTGVEMWDTGVIVDMPPGVHAFCIPRSSIYKTGYILANGIGLIDNGYHGTIKAPLVKVSDRMPQLEDQKVRRLLQLVFFNEVNTLLVPRLKIRNSSRNSGGFGSTGC